MKKLVAGVLIIGLVFVLGGCKSVEDKVAEEVTGGIIGSATGGDVEVDDDSVTFETDEGDVTVAGGEGTLPDAFPDDFPVYDDADVASSTSFEGEGQVQYHVTLATSDSVDDVYEWYKDELDSQGWTIDEDMKMSTDDGETAALSVTKGDMGASVTVSEGGEGDRVEIYILLLIEG